MIYYGPKIQSVHFNACRIRLDTITFEIPRPCFGHLTSARIASTEKKYPDFIHQQQPEEDLPLSLQPHTASPPVNIALKKACAQPTPDFTDSAPNAQFR